MDSTNALLLIGSAAAPLAASRYTSGTLTGANDWRNTALAVAALTGAYYLATRSSRAGAIALGSGGSGLLMYLSQLQQQRRLAANTFAG